MQPAWKRIAYAIEFFLATLAVFTVWSQVGGQGHLDLMPWYWKLVCGLGLSCAAVGFTVASAEQEQFWNAKSIAWLVGAIVLMTFMGGLTYHYHLLEPADEESGDVITSMGLLLSPALSQRRASVTADEGT
jgi:hypothetical protein